jgi:hypothetical protein
MYRSEAVPGTRTRAPATVDRLPLYAALALSIYAHVLPKADEQAADVIAGVLA